VVLTLGTQVLYVTVCPYTPVTRVGTIYEEASQDTHGDPARTLEVVSQHCYVATRAGESTANFHPLPTTGQTYYIATGKLDGPFRDSCADGAFYLL
jgi:hypothetical protein